MSENIQDPKTEEEEIEDNRTFEEKFKDFVQKVKPYKERFRAVRKKFLIVNFVVLILALAYLLFLTKPYFESTVTILPEYGSTVERNLESLADADLSMTETYIVTVQLPIESGQTVTEKKS